MNRSGSNRVDQRWSGASSEPDRVSRQSWLSLALVSSATFIIILDLMAANVAFPFIEDEFIDTPRSTLAWALSGNAIAAAALLLVAGRLGDRLGRRRIFLTGLPSSLLSQRSPHRRRLPGC